MTVLVLDLLGVDVRGWFSDLWDVLTGRMSLVGPRFALPKEAAQFDEELQRRTVMRPGMPPCSRITSFIVPEL